MNATIKDPQSVFVSNGEIFLVTQNRVRKLVRNGQIVTIAGTGMQVSNGDGQPANLAQLNDPPTVFVSSSDQVYISEYYGHRIRKIDRNGIISTIAGIGLFGFNGDDQLAVNAKLNCPMGLFVTDEDEILIADMGNNRVRRIDRCGVITTIAGTDGQGFNGDDQLATSASLLLPTSVFQYKGEIYICELHGHRIRKIGVDGMIKTIAGTGVAGYNGDGIMATNAQINNPFCVHVHNDQVYFSDCLNNRIRKIDGNGMTVLDLQNH